MGERVEPADNLSRRVLLLTLLSTASGCRPRPTPRGGGVSPTPPVTLATPTTAPVSVQAGGGEPESAAARAEKARVYATISPRQEKGFRRIDAGEEDGWLGHFAESVQSPELYAWQRPLRPTAERRTIVLQPLGPMDPIQTKMLTDLRDFAAAFFALPVEIAPPLPLPDSKDGTRPRPYQPAPWTLQYNADTLLSRTLVPHLPPHAMVYLGATMADLWSGSLNYVFGVGAFRERVGVYSLCRFFPAFHGQHSWSAEADRKRALLRGCKLLCHETGHMFGLSHCVFYRCGMNGSNSLSETDDAPVHFCPVCERKLLWNLGCDPSARRSALRLFYASRGFTAEARFLT